MGVSANTRFFMFDLRESIRKLRSDGPGMLITLGAILASFFYSLLRQFVEVRQGGNAYKTGDWLINYEGGYNGRGLFGQLILFLSDFTGTSVLWTSFFTQVSLYLVYILFSLDIIRRVASPYLWVFALSPLFIVFDFLDTDGAFRKELLGFASLILVVHALVSEKATKNKLAFSGIIFVIFIFSWETGICFLPVFLYFFRRLKTHKLVSKATFLILSFSFSFLSLVSVFGVYYFAQYRTLNISGDICKSLVERGLNFSICEGTIASITEHSINPLQILHHLWVDSNYAYYVPILLFSLLPFVFSGWLRHHKWITLILFCSTIPLYLFGEDYGRWIHIFGVFLTLVWVSDPRNLLSFNGTQASAEGKLFSKLEFSLLFLFVILWRVPHSGEVTFYRVTFGFLARILSWVHLWPAA